MTLSLAGSTKGWGELVTSDVQTMIAVKDVSKTFGRARSLSAWLTGTVAPSGFQALSGVSLEIRKGETVGLLGVNGAGKSTLLQLIAGTMLPNAGSIRVNGRVSALLELGAGFNPDWTGRMNAEFYCRIMGVPKAVVAQALDEVEAFADIGAFFEQPMRTYSSGMFLRVAFAAAIAVEPDIIIVDEALAVGDARFQNKCFARIKRLQDEGRTILFVTHDVITMSRFCTRGIVMSHGRILFDGAPDEAVSQYRALLYGNVAADLEPAPPAPAQREEAGDAEDTRERRREALHGSGMPAAMFSWPPDLSALKAQPYYNPHESLAGIAQGQIVDVCLAGATGALISKGARLHIGIQIHATRAVQNPSYGILIKSKDNIYVYGVTNILLGKRMPPLAVGETVAVSFDIDTHLARGDYFIDVGFAEIVGREQMVLEWRMSVLHFTIESPAELYGVVDLNAGFAFGADPT